MNFWPFKKKSESAWLFTGESEADFQKRLSEAVRHVDDPPPFEWYFEQGGEAIGPIEDADFRRMVQSGAVKEGRLVWHTGCTVWSVLSEPILIAASGAFSDPGRFLPVHLRPRRL